MGQIQTAGVKSPSKKLNRSWLVRNGKKLRNWFNGVLARYSLISNDPVLDLAQFPWIADLEADWKMVLKEAEYILAFRDAVPPINEISPDHQRLASSGLWKSYFMWGYGQKSPENCARCPETTRIVERIPGLKTALFSIHAPGMHIPPHKGVTKGICVLHLGLKVPLKTENCRIKVDTQMFGWEEGKAFVFDDTYRHEVWNRTDEDRVILLVQFDRPLRFPGTLYRSMFMAAIRLTPFIRDGRRNMKKWEQDFQRLEAEKYGKS